MPAFLIPIALKLIAAAGGALAAWLYTKGHGEVAAVVAAGSGTLLSETKPLFRGKKKPKEITR